MKRDTIITISIIAILAGVGAGIFIFGNLTVQQKPAVNGEVEEQPTNEQILEDEETDVPPVEEVIETTETAEPEPTAEDTSTDVVIPTVFNYFIFKDWQNYETYHIMFFEFGFSTGVSTEITSIRLQVAGDGLVQDRLVENPATSSLNDYIISEKEVVSYPTLVAMRGYMISNGAFYFIDLQNYMRQLVGDTTLAFSDWVGYAFVEEKLAPIEVVIPDGIDYFLLKTWTVSGVTHHLEFEFKIGTDITSVVLDADGNSGQVLSLAVTPLDASTVTFVAQDVVMLDSTQSVALLGYLTTRSNVYFVDIQHHMRLMTGNPVLIWSLYLDLAIAQEF